MVNRVLGLIILIVLSPIFLIIAIFIYFLDGKPIIFKQKRIGFNNNIFCLLKFRSMKNSVGDIPTHLIKNSSQLLSICGGFLRKYSLDELPQIINIIKGDIVFIGPRPALYNQEDLIKLRTKNGVHNIMPGITGLAQIGGRDTISIQEKVRLDTYYYQNESFLLNAKIIFKTIYHLFTKKGILH